MSSATRGVRLVPGVFQTEIRGGVCVSYGTGVVAPDSYKFCVDCPCRVCRLHHRSFARFVYGTTCVAL